MFREGRNAPAPSQAVYQKHRTPKVMTIPFIVCYRAFLLIHTHPTETGLPESKEKRHKVDTAFKFSLDMHHKLESRRDAPRHAGETCSVRGSLGMAGGHDDPSRPVPTELVSFDLKDFEA